MSQITIDEAWRAVARTDLGFREELRWRLIGSEDEIQRCVAAVKDEFFADCASAASDHLKDGLHTALIWMTAPKLRKLAIDLAKFALARGIDVNLAWEEDGRTLLHNFALLRQPAIAIEAVTGLLEHGADPNQVKKDGETPLGLAIRYGRTEVAEALRAYGGR